LRATYACKPVTKVTGQGSEERINLLP